MPWGRFLSLDGGAEVAASVNSVESQGTLVIGPGQSGSDSDLWVSDLIVTEGPLSSVNRAKVIAWLLAN